YDEDLGPRWRARAPEPVSVARLDGWLGQGANAHGHNLIPDWLDNGYCSIAFPQMPDVPSGLRRAQLTQAPAKALPGVPGPSRSPGGAAWTTMPARRTRPGLSWGSRPARGSNCPTPRPSWPRGCSWTCPG